MKRVFSILALVILFTINIPITAVCAGDDEKPLPSRPYERIVAKSGSWSSEQIITNEGAKLVVGYTGRYLETEEKPELKFKLNEKSLITGICLPYVSAVSSPVSINLKDSTGASYGDLQTKAVVMENKNKTLNLVPDKSGGSFINYIFSSEKGIILPKGEYIMTLSNYEGAVGDFIIKGFSYFAYQNYLDKLLKWESENGAQNIDYTGTYIIDFYAYKKTTLMGNVSDGVSDFSLKEFELVVLQKKGALEIIGKYEGMPFSQKCNIIEKNKNGITAEVNLSMNITNTKIDAKAKIKLINQQNINPKISIDGSATYQRSQTAKKGADFNTYDIAAKGVLANKDLPPFVMTAIGKQGNAGNIPGPDNSAQAAAGILFPPLTGLIIYVVQELMKPKQRVIRDKDWYKSQNPGLSEEQIASIMLADAMGSTDNPDEGDAISIGDNEKPGGEDYKPTGDDVAENGEYDDLENSEESNEDNSFGKPDVPHDSMNPEGEPIEVAGPDGETITRYPDGTLEISTANGETITRYPDGVTQVKTADGATRELVPEDAVSNNEPSNNASDNAISRDSEEEDNSSDLLRTADILGNLFGLAGLNDKAKDFAKAMETGLEEATDNLRNAFKSSNADDAIKSFLDMNKWAKTANTLKNVANGVNTGLDLASIGLDTLNNMQDLNRKDGSLIEGDGTLKALAKSFIANKLVSALAEKNPALVAMEIANALAFGGTEAGDIMSPMTNIKGSVNAVIDGLTDPQKAVDRALAGGYGQNLKNLTDGALLGKEALDDPGKFIDEIGQVGNDKEFFNGMYETAGKMFRNEKGEIGYFGSRAEAAAQMGVAMTETAAGMAKMVGHIGGTVYENASQKLKSFFTW